MEQVQRAGISFLGCGWSRGQPAGMVRQLLGRAGPALGGNPFSHSLTCSIALWCGFAERQGSTERGLYHMDPLFAWFGILKIGDFYKQHSE